MSSLRLTTLAVVTSTVVFVGAVAAQEGPNPLKPSEGPAAFVPKDSDSPVSALSSPSVEDAPQSENGAQQEIAEAGEAAPEAAPSDASTIEAASTIEIASLEAAGAAERAAQLSSLPTKKPAPPAPVRLMSDSKEKRLRKLLPKVDDEEIAAILADPRTILYTDEEMPKAYQFYNGAFPGVHAVSYNISANRSEPFGNGNREFPWGTPAGTHRCDNLFTFRFLHLPLDEQGKTLPVVYLPSRHGGHAWIFPVGAVFGEVLVQTGPNGRGYAFELRVRRRLNSDWDSDAFRPFPTAADLAAKIKEVEPEWQSKKKVAALVKHLETPIEMKTSVLRDHQPQRRTFSASMGVDVLPSLDDDQLVAKLLSTTTFKSAKEKYWRASPKNVHLVTVAPTTEAKFHIVPRRYDAGFVEVDQQSCMRCHETTNQDVDNFDAGRDWYGRVRGSDGVFSFHPFEPSSMSYNGFSSTPAMRASFARAGIIERYSRTKHPRSIYHRLRNLTY